MFILFNIQTSPHKPNETTGLPEANTNKTLLEICQNLQKQMPKKSTAGTKPMKLNKPSTSSTSIDDIKPIVNADKTMDDWNDDWGDNHDESSAQFGSNSSVDTELPNADQSTTITNTNTPLGLEFDLQAMNVMTRDEFDFFADMEPVIDTKKSVNISTLSENKSKPLSKTQLSMTFNASDQLDEEVSFHKIINYYF